MRLLGPWYFLCFSGVIATESAPFQWTQYSVRSGQIGPSGRKFHAFGFDMIRQFLVVFGGIGANGTVLSDTWVLDVAAGYQPSILELAPLGLITRQRCNQIITVKIGRWYEAKYGDQRPVGRYGAVYGMYNGHLIIATGCDLHYCFDDIWGFNAASFLWTRIQAEGFLRPRPRGHASGGIFMYGSTLVVSGGVNLNGDYFSDTFVFDFSQNRWHQVEAWQSVYDPSLPHPRAFQSSVMIDESTMLTFGGCLKYKPWNSLLDLARIQENTLFYFRHGACPSAATWTFDWQINKWKQRKMCAMARSHGAMGITSFNNVPFAILYGGETKSRQIIASRNRLKDNELAIFDIKSNAWSVRLTEGTKLPGNRVGAAFASTGQALYLFGGEIAGRFPNDVHILTGDPSSALTSPCGESFFTLISLHGLLMFLGFAVLLQLGGALAQYSTIIREPLMINWRYLHKAVQTLGLAFVFCAFVCGILVIPEGHYHFQSVHGCLGVSIFLLLLVQAFLGFLTRNYSDLRTLILLVHFWLGVAILLLAYVNVSLGLFLAMAPAALWISWFVYVLLVFGTGCVMLAYDCCKEKRLIDRMIPPLADMEMGKRESDVVYTQQHRVGYIPHAVVPYKSGEYRY